MFGWIMPVVVDKDPVGQIRLTNALFNLTELYLDTDEWLERVVNNRAQYALDMETVEYIQRTIHFTPAPLYDTTLLKPRRLIDKQINRVMAGEIGPSAGMSEIKPAVQAGLDDLLN